MAYDYSFTESVLESTLYKDTLVIENTTYPCLLSFNEGAGANDTTKQNGVNDYNVDCEVTCPTRTVVSKGDKVTINGTYVGIASHVNNYMNHKTLYITFSTPKESSISSYMVDGY